MSIEGIIGIAVSVGFGIYGVVSTIYKKKYPKQMEFYVLDLVRIISPLIRKYDSIKLLHNDKETQNVSFIRCMCMCTGDEDVILKSESPKDGMQVVLPKEYKWLEVQPQESSKGLEVDLTIDSEQPTILHISSELFKREEAFTFDAYIEGQTDERLRTSDIKIQHRLNNTGKVTPQIANISQTISRKRRLIYAGFMCAFLFLMMSLSAYNALFDRPLRYVDKSDCETIYSAKVVENDTIAVAKGWNGVLPWNEERYSLDEFVSRYDILAQIPRTKHLGEIILIIVYFISTAVLIFMYVRAIVLHRRKKKVVGTYLRINKFKIT